MWMPQTDTKGCQTVEMQADMSLCLPHMFNIIFSHDTAHSLSDGLMHLITLADSLVLKLENATKKL